MVALLKMGVHPGQKSFDHNKKEYICKTMFCGRGHCLSESKKIAISRTLFLIIILAILIYYTFVWGFREEISLAICQQVVEFLCVFALLKGITKILAHCLIPFMVFVIFQSIGALFLAFYFVFGSFSMKTIKDHANPKVVAILEDYFSVEILRAIAAVVCLLGSVIFFWHFLVVKRCYRYLQDVRKHLDTTRGIKPIS